MEKTVDEHREIIKNLKTKDESGIYESLKLHLGNARDFAVKTLENEKN